MKAPNCAITDLKSGLVTPEWLYYFQWLDAATNRVDSGGDTSTTPPSSPTSPATPSRIIITGPDIGTGTIGRLAKWTQPTTLGDSIVREAGTVVQVEGTLSAFTLQGDGSAVTHLNASELQSGVVPHARIPVTSQRLLGRWSPATGAMEEIALGTNLTLDGTGKLNAAGGSGGTGGGMNLDYLGDYTAGPTYNDGDIVIGADGIAYMCVVDGTTTPPEPWPGGGIAVNAAVDATYWTVTPHATLVNERALSLLANGYVKSTAGVPSTVALIPVAEGGTGATSASTARTNLGVGNVGTLNLTGDPNTWLNGAGAFTAPPAAAGVPSGMIAIFATACPAGWTRVAGWDGRYLRAAATYGAQGGAYSHAHGSGSLTGGSHAHGPGTYAGASHNHGSMTISGNTSNQGDHTHFFSNSFGGSTNAGNGSTMNVDGGSSGFMSRSDHIHSISGTVSGDTNGAGGHSHSFNGSGTPNMDGGQTISGVSAAASVAVSGSTDAQDHQPPFIDVVYCQKN